MTMDKVHKTNYSKTERAALLSDINITIHFW